MRLLPGFVHWPERAEVIEQRIGEHKRVVATADFNCSALAEHAWTSGHPVNWPWAGVRVLSVARDLRTRVVREAFAIRTSEDLLNRDEGSIPQEYDNLFCRSSGSV